MEQITIGKYIELAYDIFVVADGADAMVYSFTSEHPDCFVFGHDPSMIQGFSDGIAGLEQGTEFNFTLEPDQAFGPKDENLVMKLDKSIFEIDGKFDAAKVKPGAMVPMQTEEGYRMDGLVVEVGDKEVTLDFNHQLAGERVKYAGRVLLVRDATPEELAPKHHHCDCGCDCEHDHCHGCEGCN